MEVRGLKLIVCLTAGGDPATGGWRPDSAGMARLQALENACQPGDLVSVTGGYPNHHGCSLAARMAVEIWESGQFPRLQDGLRWVNGSTNNSVHDLGGAIWMARQNRHEVEEVVSSSNPRHLSRVRPCFGHYCWVFSLIPSGEASKENPVLAWLVGMYTIFDPTWSRALGERLVDQADKMALRHKAECQGWAQAHPEEDRKFHITHLFSLGEMVERGVIIHP